MMHRTYRLPFSDGRLLRVEKAARARSRTVFPAVPPNRFSIRIWSSASATESTTICAASASAIMASASCPSTVRPVDSSGARSMGRVNSRSQAARATSLPASFGSLRAKVRSRCCASEQISRAVLMASAGPALAAKDIKRVAFRAYFFSRRPRISAINESTASCMSNSLRWRTSARCLATGRSGRVAAPSRPSTIIESWCRAARGSISITLAELGWPFSVYPKWNERLSLEKNIARP